MNTSERNRLKFRRQYLISPIIKYCPFEHNTISLNETYFLYYHIDLPLTKHFSSDISMLLLGDIFDYQSESNNKEILHDIIDSNFKTVCERIEKYTGRFVLIYIKKNTLYIIVDNTASRKAYYTKNKKVIWVSSSPSLLGEVLKLEESKDPSKVSFYDSNEFVYLNNSNIGDTTIYDEVHQVLPNHYLDLSSGNTFRYWPTLPIVHLDAKDAAFECAKIIKGYMKNIVKRNMCMLPVTAGKDSRILLASVKDLYERVFFYINKETRLKDDNHDLRIPKSLFSKLKIKFNIINPYLQLDSDFVDVYYSNNKRASSAYLPIIYNYYVNFSNMVNLPGSIASQVLYRLKYNSVKITPQLLAEVNNVEKYKYAIDYYSKWLEEVTPICKEKNIHILNLFYWEERIANWGTQLQLEKDIAQEEYNPFNSKLLTKLFLSVDYDLLVPPYYKFHKMIIKNLWPDVLQEPINPSFKNTLKYFLNKIGLLNMFYLLKKKFVKVV